MIKYEDGEDDESYQLEKIIIIFFFINSLKNNSLINNIIFKNFL